MSFALRPALSWRLRTRTLALSQRTLLMGILNVTPDSFSDGGESFEPSIAIEHGLRLLDDGADILDIGGESTRPNATLLSPEQEQARVLPVLEAIRKARPDAVLSIDTFHSSTARLAIAAGAEIVNEVSGFTWDTTMPATCAELGCGVVLMHTHNRSQDWATQPALAHEEVVPLVRSGLETSIALARQAGIDKDQIVLDPGFGFGKLGSANFPLLAHLDQLQSLGFPLLAGTSRKGFLAQALAPLHHGKPVAMENRLHATLASSVAAILAGANLIRVHDLRPAVEAAAIADAILAAN